MFVLYTHTWHCQLLDMVRIVQFYIYFVMYLTEYKSQPLYDVYVKLSKGDVYV